MTQKFGFASGLESKSLQKNEDLSNILLSLKENDIESGAFDMRQQKKINDQMISPANHNRYILTTNGNINNMANGQSQRIQTLGGEMPQPIPTGYDQSQISSNRNNSAHSRVQLHKLQTPMSATQNMRILPKTRPLTGKYNNSKSHDFSRAYEKLVDHYVQRSGIDLILVPQKDLLEKEIKEKLSDGEKDRDKTFEGIQERARNMNQKKKERIQSILS